MAQAKKSKSPAAKSKPAKTARKTTKRTPAPAAPHRSGTKQAQMIELLSRETGATIADIVAATGWQPHTVRGAMAGALKKKLGLTITSQKVDGQRVYQLIR